VSYTGDKPFTREPLTHVTNDWRKPWPWTRFVATERWAALVDDADWGLGVFKADGGEFHGGTYGEERSNEPKHGSTAYLAPIHMENFDHNIVYEHQTELMVGTVSAMRERFNGMAVRTPPAWRFGRDRQHWTLRQATDQGFPMNGEWRITAGGQKPRMQSGVQSWRAAAGPRMELELAATGQLRALRVYWRRRDDAEFDTRKCLELALTADGNFRRYHLDLSRSPEYRELITGLLLEPVSMPRPGDELAIRSIVLSPGK
jgi:hypothetical protein